MASFEEQIQQACDSRQIPGVVLVASDAKGNFQYQKAFGPKNSSERMDLNTTFIMASCTKLMTSIAAMQCVERGQITLDEDLSPILPELKDLEILVEFEAGKEPVYKKPTTAITLRHLLTHTSGFSYDMMDPRYFAWRISRNEAPGTLTLPNTSNGPNLGRLTIPLLFEPGTSFAYGVSLDWAGFLVARLNKTTLESYMETNIWGPLGIKNITFHQELKPDVKKNLVKMTERKGIEKMPFYPLPLVPGHTEEGVEWTDALIYDEYLPSGDEYGGQGLVGSAVEYIKILDSILASDGKLLKPETIDLIFTPQLSGDQSTAFERFIFLPMYKDGFANPPEGTKMNHGLAGSITEQDINTGRKKGTLNWSGLPNLLWTIDREAGLNLFYASNVCPFGDFKSGEWQRKFETEMYRRLEESKKGVKAVI